MPTASNSPAKACAGPAANRTRKLDQTSSPVRQSHRPARLATRAASFRSGGRHHSGIPGGFIPLYPGDFVGIRTQIADIWHTAADQRFALASSSLSPASITRRAASERGSNSAPAILSIRFSRSGLTRRINVAPLHSERSSMREMYHNGAPSQLTNLYYRKKCMHEYILIQCLTSSCAAARVAFLAWKDPLNFWNQQYQRNAERSPCRVFSWLNWDLPIPGRGWRGLAGSFYTYPGVDGSNLVVSRNAPASPRWPRHPRWVDPLWRGRGVRYAVNADLGLSIVTPVEP